MRESLCLWCDAAFAPRATGGKPQRFCSQICRHAFHTACRIWAVRAFETGKLSGTELRECLYQRMRCTQTASPPRVAPGTFERRTFPAASQGAGMEA